MFIWRCPRCEQTFKKDTKQGLGLARHNHARKHSNEDYRARMKARQEAKS